MKAKVAGSNVLSSSKGKGFAMRKNRRVEREAKWVALFPALLFYRESLD